MPRPNHPYRSHFDTDQQNGDVERCAPLVKKIAHLLMSRLPPSVEIDDLIQVGMIGLLEASSQFDPSQGVLFETYASQRIRGSMLDELRRIDWLPRHARKQVRQIEDAILRLQNELGTAPKEQDIAQALNISIDDYQSMLFECKGHQLVYLEDLGGSEEDGQKILDIIEDPANPNPLEILNDAGFKSALVEAIKQLPERDQLIMSLYYEQELNLKEIGQVLDVTESRVCQLHSQAVARLRTKLRIWWE